MYKCSLQALLASIYVYNNLLQLTSVHWDSVVPKLLPDDILLLILSPLVLKDRHLSVFMILKVCVSRDFGND